MKPSIPHSQYPDAVLALLKAHGVRVGSLITCTTHDEEQWQGWLLSPRQLTSTQGDAAIQEGITLLQPETPYLYLLLEDGHGVGLSATRIAQITEHGHRTDEAPSPPPRFDLARQMLAQGPDQPTSGPLQRSLFARVGAPPEISDTICLIECGSWIERFIAPPGPSSTWQEALDAGLGHLGPLVYATAYRDEPYNQQWGLDGLATKLLETKINAHTRGLVLLHDGLEPLTTPLLPWNKTPLPCPVILLPCSQAWDRHERLDALQAAIYAARYIDVGEFVRCEPMLTRPDPSHDDAQTHHSKGHPPLGSYQFIRLFGGQKEALVATLHRGKLMLQTLHARAIQRGSF